MEGILRVRLTVTSERLTESLEAARALITRGQTEGISLEDVNMTLTTLQTLSKVFDRELNYYMETAGCEASSDVVAKSTGLSIRAVEIITQLESNVTAFHTAVKSLEPSIKECSSKLPKLGMPEFDGEILKWHGFWDRFVSSVHNRPIEDVDKLQYLYTALRGQALETIAGLDISNSNYAIAVDALQRRYGKTEVLVDAHYDALQKLERAAYTAFECRKIINHLERHLRVLESLGENINGQHLRSTIMSKLPNEVVYELNLRSTGDVTMIRRDLERIVTAMERSTGPTASTSQHTGSQGSSTEALHVSSLKQVTKQLPAVNRPKKELFNRSAPKRKQPSAPRTQHSLSTKKLRKGCAFCVGDHFSDMCKTYPTVEARRKQLNGKCYHCFLEGHLALQCYRKKRCHYCQGTHNRALCMKQFSKKIGNVSKESIKSREVLNNTTVTNSIVSYLQTATSSVISDTGDEVACRLLMDSGSQRSYVTSDLANRLNLKADSEDLLSIFTFGSESPKDITSPSAEITLKTKRGNIKRMRVNIVPHITDRLPIQSFSDIRLPIDVIADDGSAGLKIDILIGNDYYYSFIKEESIKIDEDCYVINTEFGWLFSGNINSGKGQNALSVSTYCHCYEPECQYYCEPDLPLRNMDLKFLWALESIGITDNPKATREEEAIKHFNDTVKYEDNRYLVKWPWIQYPPELPTNFGLAYGRLKGLLQRLDQRTKEEYDEILREQLNANIIEVIDSSSACGHTSNPPVHYLPHHIVKQDGKRGRIVYDASAKVREQKSLNECLYKGPSMLGDLTALLLKFRTNTVAIIADVEKAFLQLGLQKEDREVTRFLWVKELNKPLSDENLMYLRFCRVPFGIISSPFLLTATIRYHMATMNQKLLSEIADKCYVDNLVTGKPSSLEACKLYDETKGVFEDLSMNIREWDSNDAEFLKHVPVEFRAKENVSTKVLGLMWDTREDTLHLKVNDRVLQFEKTGNIKNKRELLSIAASLYDPCGLAAPLILPAKLMLQEICERKLRWDTTLPEDLQKECKNAARILMRAKAIEIPRFVGLSDCKSVEYELHCFTDASKDAYVAIVYLRAVNKGQIKVSFLISKSRVIPTADKKVLQIPRWELMGYLIGKRLIEYARRGLGLRIVQEFLWTDSIVVLSWLKSNKLLAPFVTRRIDEIKQNKSLQHCYVNTESNPADVATRPDLWNCKKDLWFSGPDFLYQDKSLWPNNMYLSKHETVLVVGEDLVAEYPETMDVNDDPRERFISDESESISDLPLPEVTNSEEIEYEIETIKKLQKDFFPDDVAGKQTHLSRNLGLFKDIDGLLRCQGRMTNTSWAYDTKHPILIPRDCAFTNELIKRYHEKNYHVGVSHTLSLIRRNYWIPKGRVEVQKILRKCLQCVKHGGGPYRIPPTPALPAERVKYSAPFTYTGIDYFGPLYVSSDKGKEKRWVCLFTCLAVRAIHMELVKDLTAEECLLALRRFTSSRGVPATIVSDNALQFKLSSELLTNSFCKENKIAWKFIPQLAPWHGGFYERMVGLVKHCMKRTMEKHLLGDSQLSTVIKEIESVINSRPLTIVGSEPEHVLRPSDFLSLGKCIDLEIVQDTLHNDTLTKRSLIEGWKKGQTVLNEFRKMFVEQYLFSLRERYTNSPKQPRVIVDRLPRIGEIVQIKGDSKNRGNWRVGKITSLLQGPDGEYRVARVDVDGQEFTRSVGHLFPIEVEDSVTANLKRLLPNSEEAEIPMNMPKADNVQLRQWKQAPRPVTELGTNTEIEENRSVEVPEMPTQQSGDVDHIEVDTSGLHEINPPHDLPEDVVQSEGPVLIEPHATDLSERCKRGAAIRAREKIAEWTRYLMVLIESS